MLLVHEMVASLWCFEFMKWKKSVAFWIHKMEFVKWSLWSFGIHKMESYVNGICGGSGFMKWSLWCSKVMEWSLWNWVYSWALNLLTGVCDSEFWGIELGYMILVILSMIHLLHSFETVYHINFPLLCAKCQFFWWNWIVETLFPVLWFSFWHQTILCLFKDCSCIHINLGIVFTCTIW